MAAATLSLGLAGPANAAQPVELHGTVIDANGTPLANAYVEVDNAADVNDTIDSTVTDANGNYSFDALPAGAVKVWFAADDPTASPVTLTSPLPHQSRWSGGSRYFKGASVTNITVDPATAPVVNGVLPQYAAVTGNVRVGADGHVATNSSGAWADDSDDNYVVWDDYTDPATGNYRIIVYPSSALRVGGYGSDTGTPTLYYLDQYWQDADTLATATPINITAGQTVSGINFRLTNALRARQAPSVAGYPTVGLPLTVSPGTWTRNAGTEFSYVWLRNGVQVGTGATYVPTAADFGQKLNVVVTALNGDYTGQSSTVTSDVVKWGATEKAGARAKAGRKVALHVKLVSAHQKPVKGKVVIMRGTKVVHKAVKLVKGKVALVLTNQPKGLQTYTVHFKGNKKIAQVDKTLTVRVHK
jgi:hypothetical protein